jgi:hypothetical protein
MTGEEEAPAGISPIAEVIALAEVLLSIGEPEKEDEKEAGE